MIRLLERTPGAPGRSVDVQAILADLGGQGGGVRCRACGHLVTRVSARMEVGGVHEHERMNPAGFLYRIGCFRVAPGCVGVGGTSTHFTWFPGCAWRVAICGGCFEHLGWSFSGEGRSFYGLILERLAEDEEGDASSE